MIDMTPSPGAIRRLHAADDGPRELTRPIGSRGRVANADPVADLAAARTKIAELEAALAGSSADTIAAQATSRYHATVAGELRELARKMLFHRDGALRQLTAVSRENIELRKRLGIGAAEVDAERTQRVEVRDEVVRDEETEVMDMPLPPSGDQQ